MKKFKLHKTVQAMKIEKISFLEPGRPCKSRLIGVTEEIEVNAEFMSRHDPQVGGYLVQYENGYTSYSPAEAFESGYSEIREPDQASGIEVIGKWEEATGPQVQRFFQRVLPREIVTSADKQLHVEILDEATHGAAHHLYRISGFNTSTNPSVPLFERSLASLSCSILFQNGPIDVDGNGLNGVTHEALLDIICHRLECFQEGQYACRENALALTRLQEARHWLAHHTRARKARGGEGTHEV